MVATQAIHSALGHLQPIGGSREGPLLLGKLE